MCKKYKVIWQEEEMVVGPRYPLFVWDVVRR